MIIDHMRIQILNISTLAENKTKQVNKLLDYNYSLYPKKALQNRKLKITKGPNAGLS